MLPYVENINTVLQEMNSRSEGLNPEEVANKLTQFGPNALRAQKEQSLWRVLLSQFMSPVVYLLILAGGISFGFGDFTEGIAILMVIFVNAGIGFWMEAQARKSMEALKQLDKVFARVIREGSLQEVDSEAIVPGDILWVEAGDIIAADARVIETVQLEINESALTGESLPVIKSIDALTGNPVLAERTNMLYKGTAVTRGNAKAVVTATGMQTELGKISDMVQSAGTEEIPLNVKLESFGKKLIWLTLAIGIPFLVVGLLEGRDLYVMLETALALAVAAIPEGLPIVATIALARGMLRLAKHQVIVKKLAAVETLGEVNIILTDKTGTLTENKLIVNSVCLPEGKLEVEWKESLKKVDFKSPAPSDEPAGHLEEILRVAVLCNNASVEHHAEGIGDPLEIALLKLGQYYEDGIIQRMQTTFPRLREQPFDSDTRVMGTLHQANAGYFVAAKGATEEILALCTHIREEGRVIPMDAAAKEKWLFTTESMANDGLRVLAFASRHTDTEPGTLLESMVFEGLLGFLDPPRADVPGAIAECKKAGIKVVMVTGDHPSTARTIALMIGLTNDPFETVVHGGRMQPIAAMDAEGKREIGETVVFSRVSPAQKLELVGYYQQQGLTAGMTGDGVNDAPALKKAEIGIAMGQRGTQVARETADMVLQDDSFPSIVRAIQQGRVIFNNIRTFIIYLLSCNLSEIFVVSLAAFGNLALPLTALQILFLNIVTDVFPALALGMGEGNPSIMNEAPRNAKEPLLSRKNWVSVFVYAIVLTFSVFGVFFYAYKFLGYPDQVCNNIAFFSLAFAQLLHPLNMIPAKEPLLRNDIVRNPHLWSAVVFCSVLLLGVYLIPYTREVLSLQLMGLEAWGLIVFGSVMPLAVLQVVKRLGVVE